MEKDLETYIAKQRATWLKFVESHKSSIIPSNEAEDVLQEVLYMLFERKDSKTLQSMLERERDGKPELDFYVKKTLSNNCKLKSAPYCHKYHRETTIEGGFRKEIEPEMAIIDPWEEFYKKLQKSPEELVLIIRKIFDNMNFSPRNREIFVFHFFEERSYHEWKGPESIHTLNKVYSKIKDPFVKKIIKYFEDRGEIFN